MHRTDGEVQLLQETVRQVQLAVFENVDLDPLQHDQPLELLIQPVDLPELLQQAPPVESMSNR